MLRSLEFTIEEGDAFAFAQEPYDEDGSRNQTVQGNAQDSIGEKERLYLSDKTR